MNRIISALLIFASSLTARPQVSGPFYGPVVAGTASSGGEIAFVNAIGSPASYGGTSSAINCASANFAVVAVSWYGAAGSMSASWLSDSSGNSYTALNDYWASGAWGGQFFVTNSAATFTSSTTFSISSSANSLFPGYLVACFAGVTFPTPVDQQNGSTGAPSAATSYQGGSVAPTSNNQLILSMLGALTGLTSPTVDSGLAIISATSGTGEFVQLGYQIQTAATAKNPTWSWSNPESTWVGVVNATIK